MPTDHRFIYVLFGFDLCSTGLPLSLPRPALAICLHPVGKKRRGLFIFRAAPKPPKGGGGSAKVKHYASYLNV